MSIRRIVQFAVSSAVLVAGACNTPSHSMAKVQARQDWNKVRARVKLQLAEQEYENKLFKQVVRTASEALVLDPTQADAYVLVARANLELGNTATAQQALEAGARAGLTDSDLIYTQGVILEQRGELEAALSKYAQARELKDTKVEYLVAEAECLVELDRPAIALRLLNAQGKRFDDDGTIAVLAGRIAELVGDFDQAVRRYRDATVIMGDNPTIARALGLLLVRLGRFDEAVAVLELLVEETPAEELGGAVRRALGRCYMMRGDAAASLRILEEYGIAHPEDVRAQLLIAEAAIRTGDMLTALRAVEEAHEREPRSGEVRLMRAVVLWKRGDLGRAAGCLFDLLADDPENVEAHCLLAEVLSARGQVEAARKHFERALEINRDCTWASEGLKYLPRDELATPQTPPTKLTLATPSSV